MHLVRCLGEWPIFRLYRGPTQLTLRKDSGLLVVLLGQNEGVNRKFRLIRRQGTPYACRVSQKNQMPLDFFDRIQQDQNQFSPLTRSDQASLGPEDLAWFVGRSESRDHENPQS